MLHDGYRNNIQGSGHQWTAVDDLPDATDRKVGGWSEAALGFRAGCLREVPVMAGSGDEIAAGTGGRGHLRASYADREQVIGTLKAAFVQGRLVKDEFDLRVGQALAPRTYAELAALTADLPAGLHFGMSRAPRPVRNAVRLMCLGAVLTLADVVTVLVTLGGVRSAAVHDLTAMQWPTVMLTQAGTWLASAPIGAGLWLWLAWANGRGYHWARRAFVPFFCLLTMVLFLGLGQDALPYTWADEIATTVLWLVAAAAALLIFNPAASPYYQRRAATRVATPANGIGR
jgi:hypothetical protein